MPEADKARANFERAIRFDPGHVSRIQPSALEEGYREVSDIYKDPAFTDVRKDPRSLQLMTSPPVSVPQ